ncbi:hypothetical protein RFI_34513 [Reticulomyxa filosa]|uniref:Uncharacterized protein n=1 Tax=Reticulomyxa filosa TaxID=46433 RepID=X6LQB0_RETFI|nr:hypothetical protein RFI_34513 [Reticulomyxa filosa]|eukprot:ETO02900.1 hypothetical protein RFI_34513 [Reticulomyxa filosa]
MCYFDFWKKKKIIKISTIKYDWDNFSKWFNTLSLSNKPNVSILNYCLKSIIYHKFSFSILKINNNNIRPDDIKEIEKLAKLKNEIIWNIIETILNYYKVMNIKKDQVTYSMLFHLCGYVKWHYLEISKNENNIINYMNIFYQYSFNIEKAIEYFEEMINIYLIFIILNHHKKRCYLYYLLVYNIIIFLKTQKDFIIWWCHQLKRFVPNTNITLEELMKVKIPESIEEFESFQYNELFKKIKKNK